MGDQLAVAPQLLPRVVTQLGSAAQTAHATASGLAPLESWANGSNPPVLSAADNLRSARQTLSIAGDQLTALSADVSRRAVLLGIENGAGPGARPRPTTRPADKPWWATAWDTVSHDAQGVWKTIEANKDTIHTVLDVAGMIPVVGDAANGINALLYLGEGDYTDAALSATALIPLAADGLLATRLGAKALKYVKDLGVAEKLLARGEQVVADSAADRALLERFASNVTERSMVGDPEVAKAVQVGQSIPELQPEVWANLNRDQKLTAIQKFEDMHAAATGRPAYPVVPYENPGFRGTFDPWSKQIKFNDNLLDPNLPPDPIVNTLSHEGRHAFQWNTITDPLSYHDPEEALRWQANMDPQNYIRYENNPYGYYSQAIERDARGFGNTVQRILYGSIP
jgi:hypothetical protein